MTADRASERADAVHSDATSTPVPTAAPDSGTAESHAAAEANAGPSPPSSSTNADPNAPLARLWRAAPEPLKAVGLVLLLLVPFLGKAYTIDDAIFLRNAQQLVEHPLRPYDFVWNWDGVSESMWKITQNPPLACYLLAATAVLGGWSEPVQHGVQILFPVGCALLVWWMARRFCRHPLLAAAAVVVSPAFLVTATSVMSDIPLLFFFLAAVACTVRGVETGRTHWLLGAGACGAAAAMTKYFGAAVAPLCLVYWLAATTEKRRMTVLDSSDGDVRAATGPDSAPSRAAPGWKSLLLALPKLGRWSPALLGLALPVAVVVAWGLYAQRESGIFHPLGAMDFSAAFKEDRSRLFVLHRGLLFVELGLAFFGGCLAWGFFLWPLAFRVPVRFAGRFARWFPWAAAGLYLLLAASQIWQLRNAVDLHVEPAHGLATGFYSASGALVLALCLLSCRARPDAVSLLLGCWLLGTLVFVMRINWTVNARIVLPAIVPAVLLLVRWIEVLDAPDHWLGWARITLAPTAALSLILAWSDAAFADAGRAFARTHARALLAEGRRVLFTGHWGLQFYMEQEGAEPLDYRDETIRRGDVIAYNADNVGTGMLPGRRRVLAHVLYENPTPFALMDVRSLSGFYHSLLGPVPYYVAGIRGRPGDPPCRCGLPGCTAGEKFAEAPVLSEFLVVESLEQELDVHMQKSSVDAPPAPRTPAPPP